MFGIETLAHAETVGAAVIGVVGGLVLTVLTMWWTHRKESHKIESERRGIASEREVIARADFVEQLIDRVEALEVRNDDLSRQLVRTADDATIKIAELDRSYRRLVGSLVAYTRQLVQMLRSRGERNIPKFDGMKVFVSEGGQAPDGWLNQEGPV